MQDRGPAAYIAEFIGTLALVFFITMAVSLYMTPREPGSPQQPFIDCSVIGLVHVFVLFMLIQTLALDPGRTSIPRSPRRWRPPPDQAARRGIYIVAQLAGGVAGALLTKGLLESTRQTR